jgi:hypothetical protein
MTEHEVTVQRPPSRTRRIVRVVLSLLLVVEIFTTSSWRRPPDPELRSRRVRRDRRATSPAE